MEVHTVMITDQRRLSLADQAFFGPRSDLKENIYGGIPYDYLKLLDPFK